MENAKEVGKIRVNTGAMLAQKTVEALRLLALYGERAVFFRPVTDTRQEDPTEIRSHNGWVSDQKAIIVRYPDEILTLVEDKEVVIIDEGQFFPITLATVIIKLYLQGKTVFYFGLNTDWRGQSWPTTLAVMSLPDVKFFRHRGYCEICKKPSTMSQLLGPDGQPVSIVANLDKVKIGGKECFRALCLPCWLETTPDSELYFKTNDMNLILECQKEAADTRRVLEDRGPRLNPDRIG